MLGPSPVLLYWWTPSLVLGALVMCANPNRTVSSLEVRRNAWDGVRLCRCLTHLTQGQNIFLKAYYILIVSWVSSSPATSGRVHILQRGERRSKVFGVVGTTQNSISPENLISWGNWGKYLFRSNGV